MAKEKKEENQDLFEDITTSQNEPANTEAPAQEKGPSRMDAAKAFFRAMYAGSDSESDSESDSDENEDNKNEDANENWSSTSRNSTESANLSREMGDLQARLREAEQKVIEAESLYKRMAADFENYRRRIDREREELTSHGARKTVETLLPALDDLDRALSVLSTDTPSNKLLESFKLVANRIVSCLEQVGVKRLVTEGQIFDPKFHEPVQQIETNEHPDGAIVQELRGGYILNDKVVRPALVNVASNNGSSNDDQDADEDKDVDNIELVMEDGEHQDTETIDEDTEDSEPKASKAKKSHSKKKPKSEEDDEEAVKVYELDSPDEK
jgi:molecular chaperone GrpE